MISLISYVQQVKAFCGSLPIGRDVFRYSALHHPLTEEPYLSLFVDSQLYITSLDSRIIISYDYWIFGSFNTMIISS